MGKPIDTRSPEKCSSGMLADSRGIFGGDVIKLRAMGSSERSLQSRGRLLTNWFDARYQQGLDPYVKFSESPTPAFDRKGKPIANGDGVSVNFASQDFLNLSSHPAIKQAATAAIERYCVHSAGSPALMGNTRLSRNLEERLEAFTGFADVTLLPTGWAAGFGIVRLLAGPTDHVVIDKQGSRGMDKPSHTINTVDGLRANSDSGEAIAKLRVLGRSKRPMYPAGEIA